MLTYPVGYLHNDSWILRDCGPFFKRCPWCDFSKAMDTFEIFPIEKRHEGIFKIASLYYLNHDYPLVCYCAHYECGPNWGYWIRLQELRADPEGWKLHLREKRWHNPLIDSAIDAIVSGKKK